MAIKYKEHTEYEGQVIGTDEHMWADGMLEEWAVIWNPVEHKRENVQIGYYGSDGQNLCGCVRCEIDFTSEIAQDIVRTTLAHAEVAFAEKVEADKRTVRKGDRVRVVWGRKVPKGTELTVFWIGERPDYMGYHNEKIAGTKDDQGNKVWIKVDYLEVLTERPEPTEEEREDFIEGYLTRNVERPVLHAARRAD